MAVANRCRPKQVMNFFLHWHSCLAVAEPYASNVELQSVLPVSCHSSVNSLQAFSLCQCCASPFDIMPITVCQSAPVLSNRELRPTCRALRLPPCILVVVSPWAARARASRKARDEDTPVDCRPLRPGFARLVNVSPTTGLISVTFKAGNDGIMLRLQQHFKRLPRRSLFVGFTTIF